MTYESQFSAEQIALDARDNAWVERSILMIVVAARNGRLSEEQKLRLQSALEAGVLATEECSKRDAHGARMMPARALAW